MATGSAGAPRPDGGLADTSARTSGLADLSAPRPVVAHTVLHEGRVWDLVSDEVDLGESTVVREWVRHPGAVAVIALDDDDRVLLLSQYRHPVLSELWEPPAGLLDVVGEPHVVAAARELAEEADLVAESWWRLVDVYTTPGGSSERIVVFLARGLTPVPEDERYERTEEEASMVPTWIPLDEAVDAVLAGRLHSPTTVTGVLAAAAARARGWSSLEAVTL
ncbi:MAG: NUDIX hydrolase [Brevundimonas sp.]